MKPWILFDYDDTLGGVYMDGAIQLNEQAYLRAIEDFVFLMGTLGFDRESARSVHHQIDLVAAHRKGFADPGRFARSLILAYHELLARHPDPAAWVDHPTSIEGQLWELGNRVWDYPYVPLPGALEVLRTVAEVYNIAVVTKGPATKQAAKLEESGIGDYADRFYPVPFKNLEDWQRVFDDLGLAESELEHHWAVGNSAKSDVNVPVSMGINGIHVRNTSWSFEQADYVRPLPGRRICTVDHIWDILEAICSFPLP
jgi:FMN phosphatase YigB (HAD superfamily)